MPGPLRRASLLVLLLAATVLGACGSGERDEHNAYVRQLNAAQLEFQKNADGVVLGSKAQSLGQYRQTLQRFEAAIASFSTKLRAITVPAAVTNEHAQLVDALVTFGADFKRVASSLDNPSARALDDARRALAAATQTANVRIDGATAAIASKLGDA